MRAWQNLCFGKGDKIMRMKKRAQEEIVGFVVIVVIVAIIFLVFLGISIRKEAPSTQKETGDVSQFLESLLEYTTACTVTYEPNYLAMDNLINECYSDSTCKSGEKACELLTRTVENAVEASWKIGPERPAKGYIFNATYVSESTIKPVLMITKGECKTERIGAERPIQSYPGNIQVSLEICY